MEDKLKLDIKDDSVHIYIDNGNIHTLHRWHIDEWTKDPGLFVSIINAVSLFYTNKKKLIQLSNKV